MQPRLSASQSDQSTEKAEMTDEELFELRRENVKRLIADKYGGVRAKACREWGKRASYLYQIVTPGPHLKNIGEQVAREIERLAGLPRNSLDKPPIVEEPLVLRADGKAALPRGVPVIALERLRDPRKGRLYTGESPMVYANQQPATGVFGFDIADFSMDPEFLPGDTVLVDPGTTPNGGDFVLARVNDDVIVRRYMLDNPGYMLGAVSEAFAPIFSERTRIEILGVITEHMRDLGVRRKRTN